MGHPVLDATAVILIVITLGSFLAMVFTNAITKDTAKRYALTRSSMRLFLYGLATLLGVTILWMAPWQLPATALLIMRIAGTTLLIAFTVWTIYSIRAYAETLRKGTTHARGSIIGYRIDNIEATGHCALIVRINNEEDEYDVERDLYLKVREEIPLLPHFENIIGYVTNYLPHEVPATLEFYPGWTMLKNVTLDKP
ncbi:MAG: hypothetical protein Q4E01_07380 [Actinomycetaceae bacterium]|nr:hypothetical protein [Actinomycetaceae bacterium]